LWFVGCLAAQVNWDIARDTPQAKQEGLIEAVGDLEVRRRGVVAWVVAARDSSHSLLMQAEMRHRYSLNRSHTLMLLSDNIDFLKQFAFAIAIVINALILLGFGVVRPTVSIANDRRWVGDLTTTRVHPLVSDRHAIVSASWSCSIRNLLRQVAVDNAPLGSDDTDRTLRALGVILTVVSFVIVVLFFLNFAPLQIKRMYGHVIEAAAVVAIPSSWRQRCGSLQAVGVLLLQSRQDGGQQLVRAVEEPARVRHSARSSGAGGATHCTTRLRRSCRRAATAMLLLPPCCWCCCHCIATAPAVVVRRWALPMLQEEALACDTCDNGNDDDGREKDLSYVDSRCGLDDIDGCRQLAIARVAAWSLCRRSSRRRMRWRMTVPSFTCRCR
jgi:hypothetical protein